jgi:phytoene synthase
MPDLDHDRLLALSYVPARRRPALEALWRLDVALGAVLAGGREPMISRIKLVWWRDTLEGLDTAARGGEPALEAAVAHILPAGVPGAALSEMEEGWASLLSPDALTPEELDHYAARRGGLLFRYSAALLGGKSSAGIEGAGEAWALVDLARHSTEAADVEAALTAARARRGPGRWPSALRPLGMLHALARRDAEPQRPRWERHGAPRRMLRMLRHRLTGD